MADSDKNIRITTSKNKTTFPNIVFSGSSAGTSVLTLEVRDDNTVAFTGTDGDVFSLDYNLSTGTIWSVNDKSGTPLLRASAGGTIGIAEFGTGVLVGIGQTNPRYKLDVQGWAGFASTGDGSYTVLLENGSTTGNNALSIRAANALRFYNSGNTLYTGFVGAQSGVNTTYTLPPTTPSSIGASFLTSTQSGVLAWIAAPAGGGSGSVNAGSANFAAYYASSSNAVSDNANLQFTGTGISIGGLVQSSSTSTGSLQVRGGFAVTGNAFIGGTAVVSNATSSTSSVSGALSVTGGLGLAGNAFIGGTVNIVSSQTSISSSSGALVVTGGVGIGGSLYTSTGSSSSVSGVLLQNGNVSASTYNKITFTAPATSATLTLANGSSLTTVGANSLTLNTSNTTSVTLPTAGTLTTTGNDLSVFASTTSTQLATLISDETGTAGKLVFSTSPVFTTSVATDSASFNVFNTTATTINAFQAGTAISVGAATGTFTINNPITLYNQTTPSTSVSTGAIVSNGGVGIGLSASIGGRLQMFNGANYTAFVSSATGNTVYVLPPTAPSSIGASYLSSSPSGTMAWVSAPSGGSGSPGGSTGQIQYNNAGSFGGISGLTYSDPNNGIHLVVNTPPDTVTATYGVLNIGPAPFDGISPGQWGGSTKGTIVAINAGNGFTGNFLDFKTYNVAGFAVSNNGQVTIGNNVWSLPVTAGSAGQVLTSNGTGSQAYWSTVSGGPGAGSGTVAIPGAQYQIAGYYWSATGASVSGSSTLTNNLATAQVNITHTTPSSSTSTGALVVSGSVGVGGSLYVGSQINQTYQPVLGAAIDHALFLQSNPVPTNVGALIQIGSANKWDGVTSGFFSGSPNGTYLGINAALGNTSNLVDFQENGVTVFSVGAGGTNIRLGQALSYIGSNVLASFASSVNSYNQVVLQNKSNGTSASADFVLNNDISTDTTTYGNLGINSSTFTGSGSFGLPNATYLSATTGPLVLGTTTPDPIRFVVNGGTTDVMYISESGTAISVFTNFGLRSASDLRLWNAGNTFYGAFQGGNYSSSYILTMPTTNAAVGSSLLLAGSDNQLYFVAPGSGIAFSAANSTLPVIRAKRPLNVYFANGYTPTVAGADSAVFRIPESSDDGTTVLTYVLKRFTYRVETPSAGQSRIQIERSSSDTGAFALAATGSSHLGGLGLTISGAGIYITSTTSFAGTLVTSGNLLRLNWTLLNATHANFSAQLILQEV